MPFGHKSVYTDPAAAAHAAALDAAKYTLDGYIKKATALNGVLADATLTTAIQLSAVLAGFTGEELILAANEKTSSVIVSGDKTTGNIVNVIFTLAAAADVVIKASNTKGADGSDASFIKADNFTLKAYSDPLAALKEQLATLKAEATTALANGDYANVTGDEKTTLTTLSTLVPEETEEAYNTAISNITAAISDFTGAKSNYDALATVNAEVDALATLTYADANKKPAKVSASTAEEAATKADAQTAAIRAYYESNALAEGVDGAVNQTSKLTNPTNPTSTSGWTVNNTTGNSNMRTMSSEPYTNADGTTAEAKTLGFEAGEYAPYNNVAALTALAAAKAIDPTVENMQEDVQAATAALTSATWTANDGDVDAIYNGMFATVAEGQNYPDGWKRTNGWGQMQSGLEGNFATAYYNQPGSLQYGNQGVYTMPLAANTAYQLTFSYRSHENNSNQGVTVSVLNGEGEGLKAVTFERNGSTSEWASVRAYFTTGAAGNYVLTLANGGNTWMTDVSLNMFSYAELQLADDEGFVFNFDKIYMEKVAVTRKVVEGYNTVCMPFDLTAEQVKDAFGENAKVYTFEEVANGSNSTINFNTKEGNTIAANVPVLVGDATASTAEVTFNGVIFKSYVGDSPVVAGTNFDFVGTYDASTDIAAGDYFIGNGAIYKSTGATTIKAFRAYIKTKTSGAGVKLFIGGIETAISEINGTAVENGAIYNLAGQRVNKAQKGVFIVNGKKVIVK